MEAKNHQDTGSSGQVWPPPPNVRPPTIPPPPPGSKGAAFALWLSVFSVVLLVPLGMTNPIFFYTILVGGLASFIAGVIYWRFWMGKAAAGLQIAWFILLVVFYFIFEK